MSSKSLSMAQKRTCFVISPIGEDDSPTRKHADDVFDLLIEPALDPFHFDVIRADKIPGPSSITEDMIRLVQEADLCVVDLTERNPNVFYECGRRHETGKPAILIIKKGDQIPFDLSGIRTIAYDISDARTTRLTVKRIQEFVREIEQTGFEEISSGATLTNIMESLARLERKVNSFTGRVPTSASPAPNLGLKNLMTNPQAAMQHALVSGDLPTIVSLLPRIEQLLGPSEFLVAAAGVAAVNGEASAAETLFRALEHEDADIGSDARTAAVSAIVQYYVATDREIEGAQRLEPIAERLLQSPDLTDEDKSRIHNQMQMIQYGAEMFEEALKSIDRAIEINPQEPAYYYNKSMIYEELKDPKRALEAIDKVMEMGSADPQHLAHAYRILIANNEPERAQEILERLQDIDPARAAFVQTTSNLQDLVD